VAKPFSVHSVTIAAFDLACFSAFAREAAPDLVLDALSTIFSASEGLLDKYEHVTRLKMHAVHAIRFAND
jgi:hypothetical protein